MALYLAVKRLGLEAYHSPLSSASIKNELSTSTHLKKESLFGSVYGMIERSTNRCFGCIWRLKNYFRSSIHYVIELQVVMNLGFPYSTGNCLIKLWLSDSHEGLCSMEIVMVLRRVNKCGCVTSSDGVLSEEWIGRDVEESGVGLFEVLFRPFHGRDWRNALNSLSWQVVFRLIFEHGTSQIRRNRDIR